MLYRKSFRFLVTSVALLLLTGYTLSGSTAAPATVPLSLGPVVVISEEASAQYEPAIAYNSKHNEYLVVWENSWANGYHDVYAARVSADGRLLSTFVVSSNPDYKKINPSVAYDPDHDRYLVVFAYDVFGNGSDWDIYGRFIPWNGPDAYELDRVICSWTTNQMHPVVAFGRAAGDHGEFMVAWVNAPSGQPNYISARRVFADGSGFPPGDGFTVSSGSEHRDFPDVAYNLHRNEYLVIYDVEKNANNLDIYGIRLRDDGVPLTGGNPNVTGEFPIAGWPDYEEMPAVAACYQADQYLVAWQSDIGTSKTNFALYAFYLNGDAIPGNIYEISHATLPKLNVDVACDFGGNGYLLAWQGKYVGGEYGIWARQASASGSLGPEFEVYGPRAAADREHPAVAGGYSNFMTAWEHDRDNGNIDICGRLLGYYVFQPLAKK